MDSSDPTTAPSAILDGALSLKCMKILRDASSSSRDAQLTNLLQDSIKGPSNAMSSTLKPRRAQGSSN